MPFSHFPGTGRGGFTPPVDSIRRGGFTLNRFTGNGFTLNKVHREEFIVPVDALRHGRSLKPFRMRRYEKWTRKSLGIRTYKNKGLKLPWNEYLQKNPGGPPPCLLLSPTR